MGLRFAVAVLQVDPLAVAAAAREFEGCRERSYRALIALTTVLAHSGGMAGNDPAGLDFAGVYQPAAEEAINIAGHLVESLDRLGFMLALTADNHARAENASIIPGFADTGYNLPANPGNDSGFTASTTPLPAAAGSVSVTPAPTAWSMIQHLVHRAWPNGHQDKLTQAGDAWAAAATGFEAAQPSGVYTVIAAQQMPETDAILAYVTDCTAQIDNLAGVFRSLAQGCHDYAHALDQAHHKIISELTGLADMVGISIIVSIALPGIGTAASAVLDSARLALAASRVAIVIDALLVMAASTVAEVDVVWGSITSVRTFIVGVDGIRATAATVDFADAVTSIGTVQRIGDDIVVTTDNATVILDDLGDVLGDSELPVEPAQIDTTSGTTGNWNQALNKPAPNTTYNVDDSTVFTTDAQGRTVDAKVDDLQNAAAKRNQYQQKVAGRADRLPTDQGGHIIAAQFGGPGEAINLTAMDAGLNGAGANNYYALETQWAKLIDAGHKVSVDVNIVYDGGSLRPAAYLVQYQVDGGAAKIYTFDNG